MAGYMCGGCDGAESAAILVTPLNGAETLAVGEACMPVTLARMLAGTLGIDAEELWAAAEWLMKHAQDQEAGPAGESAEAEPEDSVFVRVPHGTPGDEPEPGPGESAYLAGQVAEDTVYGESGDEP